MTAASLSVHVLCGILGLSGSSGAHAPGEVRDPFSITLSMQSSKVETGTPIKIEVAMKNVSKKDVYYAEGAGQIFQMEVRDEAGTPARETPEGVRARLGPSAVARLVVVTLKPGMTFASEVDLNALYDVKQPGTYTVQFQRRDPEIKVLVKSNKLSFTVVPKPGP